MQSTGYRILSSLTSRDWQVETIGDAYMVVSGAPTVSNAHAQNIANMALDMIASLADFVAPAAGGNIHIRIGQLTTDKLLAPFEAQRWTHDFYRSL